MGVCCEANPRYTQAYDDIPSSDGKRKPKNIQSRSRPKAIERLQREIDVPIDKQDQ